MPSDRGSPPLDHPAFDVRTVGGMKPWICSYRKDGRPFGITLYGIDAGQVLEDNCADLEGLVVEGEACAQIPVNEAEAWAVIDAYERSKGGHTGEGRGEG